MCDFSFDPSLWPKDVHMFDDVWDCPYPAVHGENYCIFHIHPYLREVKFGTQSERNMEYIKAVRSVGILHVICTTIRRLDLEILSKLTYRNDQIQIGYSTILDEVTLSESNIDGYTVIEDCRISEVDFERGRISSGLRIQRSTIGSLQLSETVIEGQSSFVDSFFEQSHFVNTRFKNTVSFSERIPDDTPISDIDEYIGKNACVFSDTATFMGTQFERSVFFAGVEFQSGANFNEAEFKRGGAFMNADFSIGCHFGSAEFQGKVSFDNTDLGKANFEKTEFQEAVRFDGAHFGSKEVFKNIAELTAHCSSEGVDQGNLRKCTNIMEDTVFGNGILDVGQKAGSLDNIEAHDLLQLSNVTSEDMITAFSCNIYFMDLNIEFDSSSPTISFFGSNISDGTIRISDDASFVELANTNVGNISVLSDVDRNPFKNIYIENTTFDGFDFARYRTEFREINWEIDGYSHEDSHKSSDHPEGTYAHAKAGAQSVGDYYAESKFFVKEQRHRRIAQKEKALQTENWLSSVKHSSYYLSNLSYDLLCKYAESSKRVFGWSLLMIFLFAGIYGLFGIELPYGTSNTFNWDIGSRSVSFSYIKNIIFSLESFSAFLVGGGPQITDPVVRILSSVQAFIGTFLTALFVATLIRSVKR
ncbi:hypothetical protein PN419_09870 [Halorubrum ezzemoulense]|uniref:pentapeptide repeat-containing protein n=1 Tax=Halorubrum ezzemoulense TaxID=337243 RepID=UPI00232AC4C2|nr:pentapeptide repeat-containing protein [Halorubrum ezzemoulense]MDB9249300.1 hypothetical protein [Halorubrum ezzemoulense]MDB9259544.1 hypothetical protein [Halorubrum ezzemoulense]MDB9263010.1 hypothetical protein [Halorubrum ezzemoulense]MDB9266560.1 hypothetical protein [Halorubrum ezzemoulense]MDB9269905.1 hypothetical protein [Halorubrum ezzemoulense]